MSKRRPRKPRAKEQRIAYGLSLPALDSMTHKQLVEQLVDEFGISKSTAKTDVTEIRRQQKLQAYEAATGHDALDPGKSRYELLAHFHETAGIFDKQARHSLLCKKPQDQALATRHARTALEYRKAQIRLLGLDKRLPEDELSETQVQRALVNAVGRSVGGWDMSTLKDLFRVLGDELRHRTLDDDDDGPGPDPQVMHAAQYL